jgi:diaminohydroxyphosphoribosylaminopyrimidine deaminase/5-amino-6-(5-phosphoribosylamino)uracil reductase
VEPGKSVLAVNRIEDAEKKKAFTQLGVDLLELPSEGDTVDLKRLLKILAERQITSVLVEGGGILLGSFFDQKLVDKVVAFIAPIIIGGQEAKIPVAGEGVGKLAEALQLERISIERFGDDLMVTGYIKRQ